MRRGSPSRCGRRRPSWTTRSAAVPARRRRRLPVRLRHPPRRRFLRQRRRPRLASRASEVISAPSAGPAGSIVRTSPRASRSPSTSSGASMNSRLRAAVAALVVLATVLAGCRTVTPPDPARVTALSDDLGQLLLVGFRGTDADAEADLDRLFCRVRAGGGLLFGHNIVDAAQVTRLTARIRERARLCGAWQPLVAVDAEGGRVMRLGAAAGYTPTLSADELGASNDLALT